MKVWVHYPLVGVIALAAGFVGATLAADEPVSDAHIEKVAEASVAAPEPQPEVSQDLENLITALAENVDSRTRDLSARLAVIEGREWGLAQGPECTRMAVGRGVPSIVEVQNPYLNITEPICVVER